MEAEIGCGSEVEEIESRILAFVRRELLSADVLIDRADDLLSGELLDSLGLMRLAAFVEDDFGIEFHPADLVVENFQTIVALAEFVRATGGRPADSATTSER